MDLNLVERLPAGSCSSLVVESSNLRMRITIVIEERWYMWDKKKGCREIKIKRIIKFIKYLFSNQNKKKQMIYFFILNKSVKTKWAPAWENQRIQQILLHKNINSPSPQLTSFSIHILKWKRWRKKIMEQQLTQFVVLCGDENFVLSSNANVINFVLFRILNLNQSIKRNRN